MFAAIGVRLEWVELRNECSGQGVIVITLSYETSPADHPDAWAYALPYEGAHIVVFWDRVQHTVAPARSPILLAHVMAHEIAHILEGVSQHAETGIMKARWGPEDFFQMGKAPLTFTPKDIDLIHRGVEARSLAAQSPTK